MAMATASGVDELRSGVLGRGSRGRGREQRVREKWEGVGEVPWHSWRRPEAAEAGGGLARGDHTPGVPLASFWREVGDGGGSGGLGQLLGRGGAPGMSR